MKKILIILIIANLALFISMGAAENSNQSRKSANAPLQESKIKLVESEIKEKIKPDNIVEQQYPVNVQEKTGLPVEKATENKQVSNLKSDSSACLEWGEFSGSELDRVEKSLAGLNLSNKLGRREVEYETSYWVYMPPLKDKRAVARKVREIKKLGINEYFVVGSAEKWANAISLGVFKTHEAAENHLKYLRTKGIRTAIVGERGTKLRAVWFEFNAIDSETKAKLLQMQKEYNGSELKNTNCALTKDGEIGKMPRSSR